MSAERFYARAKMACEWRHPVQRKACSNCGQIERTNAKEDIGKVSLRCKQHGFYTTAMAVCRDWDEKL